MATRFPMALGALVLVGATRTSLAAPPAKFTPPATDKAKAAPVPAVVAAPAAAPAPAPAAPAAAEKGKVIPGTAPDSFTSSFVMRGGVGDNGLAYMVDLSCAPEAAAAEKAATPRKRECTMIVTGLACATTPFQHFTSVFSTAKALPLSIHPLKILENTPAAGFFNLKTGDERYTIGDISVFLDFVAAPDGTSIGTARQLVGSYLIAGPQPSIMQYGLFTDANPANLRCNMKK